MRIQKFLSRSGVASRRRAEQLVRQGRVSVDGVVVTALGTKVDPDGQRVELDGEPVRMAGRRWIRFHKPRGVLTTARDPARRPTIYDRLPGECAQLRYLGRLDRDTEGLLLLTNDGDLANRLQHPRFGVEREYVARVQGVPGIETLKRLRSGVELADGWARPRSVKAGPPNDGSATLTLVLTEGRKREVRRLLSAVGHPVIRLKRVRFGPIELGALPYGEWEELGERSVRALERCVGDADSGGE